MKTQNLLKAIVIAVPVLVAVYASYNENKKHKELVDTYKTELISDLSEELTK